jgi:hypothetical protein
MKQGVKPLSSSRSNGATTTKKQLGKARTVFVLAIQTSCYRSEGMCNCSLSVLEPFLFQISGQDFCVRGEGYDTPSVTV